MQPFSTHTGMVMTARSRQRRHGSDGAETIFEGAHARRLRPHSFYDWRYLPGEKPNPDFVLNFPRYKGASVCSRAPISAGGSSREHAPWGVKDYGFRVVIAPVTPTFSTTNCFKNGILPATLPEEQVDEIFKRTEKEEGYSLTVNLAQPDRCGQARPHLQI